MHELSRACEHLLAGMAIDRLPPEDEGLLIKHYCNEVARKVDSPAVFLSDFRGTYFCYHAATRTVESSSTRWFWIVGVSMFIRLWDLDQLVDNLI